MNAAARLKDALELLATDPLEAARRLDELAARLHELAAQIRSGVNPLSSPGGMGDRVQMAVRGPDGSVRHYADTQRR